MIRSQYLSLILVCITGISLIGCHRLQPLRSPTFQVATSDQGKIQEAIRQALLDRHWSIIAKRADGFDAEYKRTPDQGAKIRVTHIADTISIKYLESTDLEYHVVDGIPEIHKRYNGWVANLERDIQVEVGRRL
jgi:hypothetical protein